MRRIIIVLFIVIIAGVAGAYLYFSGREYVVRIPEAQIQEKVGQKLPFSKSYFTIFEVTLDHPRIALVEGSNRVKAGVDILLNIQLGGQPRPLGGSVDVSGGIKYVSEKGQFFLTDPLIEQLRVQGIPPVLSEKVSKVLAKALGEFYEERPIYTLSDLDLKQVVAKAVLRDVSVADQVLILRLGL